MNGFNDNVVSPSEHHFSMAEVLYVLRKYRRSIVVAWLAAIVAAGLYVVIAMPIFIASTQVLVNIGREKVQNLDMQTRPVANMMFQEREQDVNNEVELLRNPALLRAVFPQLKERLAQPLPPDPPAITTLQRLKAWTKRTRKDVGDFIKDTTQVLEEPLYAAGMLKRRDPDEALMLKLYYALSVASVKDTDVVNVGFAWNNPDFAADALNIYIAEYQRYRLDVFNVKHSVSFYETQLSGARGQLAQAEAALSDYLKQGGITNLDAQKTLLLNTTAELRQEADKARIDLQGAQLKLSEIDRTYRSSNAWIETPDASDSVAGTQALDQSFVTLFAQRNKLLSRLMPGAEQVRNIDDQIAKLRQQKYESLRNFYRVRIASLSDKLARLNADITGKTQQLSSLTGQTTRYDQLQQNRSQLTTLVADYKRKVEDMRVNEDMNAKSFTSVRVISPAMPPVAPSAPKSLLVLGLAAAFGLVIGIAYAVILEFLDHTFRQPAHVVRVLHIPVLASVPDVPRR